MAAYLMGAFRCVPDTQYIRRRGLPDGPGVSTHATYTVPKEGEWPSCFRPSHAAPSSGSGKLTLSYSPDDDVTQYSWDFYRPADLMVAVDEGRLSCSGLHPAASEEASAIAMMLAVGWL